MRAYWGLTLIAITFAGCGINDIDLGGYACEPDFTHLDARGVPTCRCSGQCVPKGAQAEGWEAQPVLVWMGDIATTELPECPEGASGGHTEHFAEPQPGACGPCTCKPPTGACGLPTEIKVHAAACPGTWATEVPFDPLQDWVGTCSADDMIMQNAMCPEGACVQSLTVGPLLVTKDECGDGIAPPRSPEPYFKKHAIVCEGTARGECLQDDEDNHACVPKTEGDAEEFQVCIMSSADGDRDCPPKEGPRYTEKHVLSKRVTQACSCTCTPVGSKCTATLSFYRDDACTDLVDDLPFASTGESCVDIMPAGQALRSKEISPPVYVPGTCEPHSEVGPLQLEEQRTYCCIPLK